MGILSLTAVKITLVIAIFIVMVRFIFSSSREEQESRLSAHDLKEEINDIKKGLDGKDVKEKGELMDSLMEEYYSSKNSDIKKD